MTKTEAIELMKQGIKMTHKYFEPHEWVYIDKNGLYILENGIKVTNQEYWSHSTSIFLLEGWEKLQITPERILYEEMSDNFVKILEETPLLKQWILDAMERYAREQVVLFTA